MPNNNLGNIGEQEKGSSYSVDELDLQRLFVLLWSGKWWIVIVTAAISSLSVFYALALPNIYESRAILAPKKRRCNLRPLGRRIAVWRYREYGGA